MSVLGPGIYAGCHIYIYIYTSMCMHMRIYNTIHILISDLAAPYWRVIHLRTLCDISQEFSFMEWGVNFRAEKQGKEGAAQTTLIRWTIMETYFVE